MSLGFIFSVSFHILVSATDLIAEFRECSFFIIITIYVFLSK